MAFFNSYVTNYQRVEATIYQIAGQFWEAGLPLLLCHVQLLVCLQLHGQGAKKCGVYAVLAVLSLIFISIIDMDKQKPCDTLEKKPVKPDVHICLYQLLSHGWFL